MSGCTLCGRRDHSRANCPTFPHANGCHNRPEFVKTIEMADTLVVPRREEHASAALTISRNVPFAMQRECQYTRSSLGQADKGCLGCRHRSNVKEEK